MTCNVRRSSQWSSRNRTVCLAIRSLPLPSFGAHTPHTSTTYQPYLYHLFSCRIIGYAARPPTPVCVARRVSAHHAVGTAQRLYGFMAHVPTVPSGTEGVPW